MRIDINIFDDKSIDNAIKALDKYKRNLEKASAEIAERLAKLGAQTVDNAYHSVPEDKPFDVFYEPTKNGWLIVALGENVIFLEFGTGVYTTDYRHPEAVGLPPIEQGEWSKNEGSGVFVRHGHWHYRRKYYEGTIATQGFYFAKQEIKEQAYIIAREVFHKWLT